jgi:hypothetical protein
MKVTSKNVQEHQPDVVLLSDDPSSVDAFGAKAHENVAGAIADLIENEPGGRVIGLEGSWGSGKSTIVQLLRDRLLREQESPDSQPGARVVVFDAWAHQGDPLRRSFLETVIKELESAEWLSTERASEFCEQLAGKSSEKHTTSTARLSFEGRLTSIAALLVPLGIVLSQNRFHVQSYHRSALVLGLFLLAAPLLVLLGFLAAKGIGLLLDGKAQPEGKLRKLADLPAFSFFANEQKTTTTTEGIERGEPTSVVFEQLFSDVLSASLTGSRRLLVVLDNLDRVEEDDAQKVLATMHTFISSGDHLRTPWKCQFWTLIPYDPNGLDRLWRPEIPPKKGDPGEALAASNASAFVEKIFQVRFEAPPLVPSNWREYLFTQLEQALPTTAEKDLLAVLRLRAIYPSAETEGAVSNEMPTPRQIKQFVNQIGAIRRQRDDIPLVHIAYYTLLRRDQIINVPHRLRDGTLPHKKLTHLLTETSQDDLAALHFGTDRDLGQQLLLGDVLEKALIASDVEEVKRLSQRSGYVDALESLDLGGRTADGGIELTRSVAALDEANALVVSNVADWFSQAIHSVTKNKLKWALSGRETGVGLAVILAAAAEKDSDLQDLLSYVEADAGSADADGHLQLEGAAGLLDELISRRQSATPLRITIPPDRLVSSLSYFGAQTPNAKSRAALDIPGTPDELIEHLVAAVTSEHFQEARVALDVIESRPGRVDLVSLGSRCVEWLKVQDPASVEQLGVLLDFIDLARRAGSPESILGAAAEDGTLMHLVGFASRNGADAQAGAASMLHLSVRPAFGAPQQVRESPTGTQIVQGLLTDPSANEQIVNSQLSWLTAHSEEAIDLLMAVYEAAPSFGPWVDHQLSGLFAENTFDVSIDQYLHHWPDLQRALGENPFAALTRALLNKSVGRKSILSSSSDPTFALAVLTASSSEPPEAYVGEIRVWARGIVNTGSEETWKAELGNPSGGPVLALALQLSGTPDAPIDPPGLKEALHTHSRALANAEPAWQPDPNVFTKLTSLLSPSARRVLASGLCAWLEGRDGDVGQGFIPTYGAFLGNEKSFRTHEKLPNFVGRLIARDAWTEVLWFVELAEGHPDTIQVKNRRDEIEQLTRTVKEKLASFEEDPPEALVRLSRLLARRQKPSK